MAKRKAYYINGFRVHRNTYKQYLAKEFKRVRANCKNFDENIYKLHDNIVLNGIEFQTL